MTGKPDDLVPVNVNVSSLVDAHTCDTVSHVVDGGTVSDLRVVLVQDGVIRSGDGSAFKLPGGRIVGKSSEDHLKWHSLLENDEVHVLLVPAPTADLSDGLSVTAASDIFDDDKHLASTSAGSPSIAPQDRDLGEFRLNERLSIIRRSKLGEGINVCDDHGPQFSGHSAVADIDPSTIRVMDIDDAQYEAIVTSSARTAAYLSAGWTMPAINSTEFARSGQGRSNSTSTSWVTGRYLLSSCQLTLPGAHILKPHPELQAAVDRALAEQDPVRCTQRLDAVWQCYGHVYVDSVEMGGMCHLTSAVTASEQLDSNNLKTQMECALQEKFDFQDELPANFKRAGGLKQSEDISQWESSLARSANWSVTRTLRVVPVIDLLDEETQRKILTQNPPPSFERATPAGPREMFGETGTMELPSFRGSTTTAVSFTQRFDHPPFVFLGINRLDFNHTTIFRFGGKAQSVARDHADLDIFAGNDTVHYGSNLSWLAFPFADPDLQHGTFDTPEFHPYVGPRTQVTSRVTFERPYNATPKVILWLHHIHMDSSDERIRIAVYVKDVSREGFTLHVDTWDGSQILEVGVSWLAHSVSRAGFASGTYDTRDVHPDTEPRQKTSGHVGFGDAQFARRPTSVFTALHRLDISKATTPRLALSTDNVTETGMDWHIDTWWDSTLYAASASFIAF